MLFNEIKEAIITPGISVSDILRKTMVLSYDLKNEPLKTWVNFELDGYNDVESTPAYRFFRGMSFGDFQDPFQIVRNAPIHLMAMPKELLPRLTQLIVHNGVKEIEELIASADSELRLPWPAEIIAIYNSMGNRTGLHCVSAWRILTKSQLVGVIDSVRNRLLKFLLDLEVAYPELVTKSAQSVKVKQSAIIKIFNNCIIDNRVSIGSKNKFSGKTKIQTKGD